MLKFALLFLLAGHLSAQSTDYKFSEVELKLIKSLIARQPEDSITFSPLSIRSLLAMVKEGAGGNTKQVLDRNLGDTKSIEKAYERPPRGGINFGNAVYLNNNFDINESFKNAVTDKFKAVFQYADFSKPKKAVDNINEWIKRVTDKQIRELIEPSSLSQDTVFLMLNAIHLIAKWKDPFEKSDTHDRVFWEQGPNGVLVPKLTPIMHRYDHYRYGNVPSLGAKVVEIPFQTPENYAMYFVLPDQPNGLKAMINRLTPESLQEIYKSIGGTIDLYLYVPRFQIKTTKNLKEFLPDDLGSIFSSSHDITGITGNRNVQLNDVLHKAILKVDEEGVTGSAVSGIDAVNLSLIPPTVMNISYPFMYFIAPQAPPDGQSSYGQNIEVFFMGFVGKLDESKPVPSHWGEMKRPINEETLKKCLVRRRGQIIQNNCKDEDL